MKIWGGGRLFIIGIQNSPLGRSTNNIILHTFNTSNVLEKRSQERTMNNFMTKGEHVHRKRLLKTKDER